MTHDAPTGSLSAPGHVGSVARALGFAGLLPQIAAAWLTLSTENNGHGQILALFYGSAILSFLGGMWWGFAMRRTGGAQARLAIVAVLPSLAMVAIVVAGLWLGDARPALVTLGAAVIGTLPVDYHLFRKGEAPTGWMALRVPLSVGLGALTILAGIA